MSLPVTPRGHVLGRKHPRTPHHLKALHAKAVDPSSLPSAVDMRPLCPPVWDQGQQGSCTAHAIAGAIAVVSQRAINGNVAQPPVVIASRSAIYYQERDIEGDTDQDAGAEISDGLTVVSEGIVLDADMPYNDADYTTPPSSAAMADAAAHAVTNHEPLVIDLPTVLGTLAQGYPVVLGIQVMQSFEDTGSTGDVPMPGSTEQSLGGHAVVAVGYDQARQVLVVRNSWSITWSAGGYCYVPFAFILNSVLTNEAHAVRALR